MNIFQNLNLPKALNVTRNLTQITANLNKSQPISFASPSANITNSPSLLNSSQISQLVQLNSQGHVLGLGWALFTCILLALLLIIICILQSKSEYAAIYYFMSPLILATTVGVLYALPKYHLGDVVSEPKLVDRYWHPRVAFLVVSSLLTLALSLYGLIIYAITPVYAIKEPEDQYESY